MLSLNSFCIHRMNWLQRTLARRWAVPTPITQTTCSSKSCDNNRSFRPVWVMTPTTTCFIGSKSISRPVPLILIIKPTSYHNERQVQGTHGLLGWKATARAEEGQVRQSIPTLHSRTRPIPLCPSGHLTRSRIRHIWYRSASSIEKSLIWMISDALGT